MACGSTSCKVGLYVMEGGYNVMEGGSRHGRWVGLLRHGRWSA